VSTTLDRRDGLAPASRHRGRARPHHNGRRLLLAGLAVLTVVAALAAWMVVRGVEAKNHLMRAASDVTALQHQADAGDVAAQRITLAQLQGETRAARSETSDPVWRAVGLVPLLGRNDTAIATLAASVDDLAEHALPPLVAAAATVNLHQLAPRGGHLDVTALQRAAGSVTTADQAVRQVLERVDALSTSGLLPPVRSAVEQLRVDLHSAAQTTGTAARAVTLLPPMLGADGPRTYALLFLNNAELRAGGGIPGSWAILRADHGQVEILNQGSAADVNARMKGVAVPADIAAVYTSRAGTFFQDVTLTPNFPAAAKLASSMLEQAYGVQLDGVIATDPVALADVLQATGAVKLPLGGSLTAGNAVSLLLSEVYRTVPDPQQQDAFFAEAAKAVFDALSGGQGDPRAVVQSLADAAAQGRLSIWSARAAEEQQIAGTPLAGPLPSVDAPGQPNIGVFLNDGTAAKLDYYLREQVSVSSASCPTGRVGFQVQITLTSTVPASAKTTLPAYVTGAGVPGLTPGAMRTQVYVYAPSGGAIVGATADGRAAKLGSGVESGRPVGIVTVDLAPGQTTLLRVTVESGSLPESVRESGVVPGVRVTPLAIPALLRTDAVRCPGA
jgi:hypothetical protein